MGGYQGKLNTVPSQKASFWLYTCVLQSVQLKRLLWQASKQRIFGIQGGWLPRETSIVSSQKALLSLYTCI